MRQTETTLLEQMKISEFEIAHRKTLFDLDEDDLTALREAKSIIDERIDEIVALFYESQTSVPEIALLIGDADTLNRLRHAQRKYVIDLFSGLYDIEYVNNRLRIGLVHKRIGVEPKLYLSAIYTLKSLLTHVLRSEIHEEDKYQKTATALEKLMMFDVTLVFDTYIRSLLAEIEISKQKSDEYALHLENRVRLRTQQLEELSRTDALTGLLNVRHLNDTLTSCLRASQRRAESISVVYLDINNFKQINDTQGHNKGDEVLRTLGGAISKVSRSEDSCFRCGGDEFCIILPDCASDNAEKVYRTRLQEELTSRCVDFTISIGVADTGPNEYLEPEDLLHQADKNMYADKRKNKAREAAATQPE
ncbi:diguanylate cyclase domain-containing protein [Pontibacter sp. JAM-7]|uniref:diguanylate cyclase domain-containing protein n=1 Tax=Pontibacter sp. JAM-7 TaxID=3366581 RepID=UPI003AF65719